MSRQWQDCYDLAEAHWYGGAEQYDQHWPIENDTRPFAAYVTGDTFQALYGGVLEPYWLNSNGFAVYADRDQPLFVGLNDGNDGRLCLASRYQFPYVRPDANTALSLSYSLCSGADVKSVHLTAASRFWSKPRDIPDERMLTHPVWSTWARYKTLINQVQSNVFVFVYVSFSINCEFEENSTNSRPNIKFLRRLHQRRLDD